MPQRGQVPKRAGLERGLGQWQREGGLAPQGVVQGKPWEEKAEEQPRDGGLSASYLCGTDCGTCTASPAQGTGPPGSLAGMASPSAPPPGTSRTGGPGPATHSGPSGAAGKVPTPSDTKSIRLPRATRPWGTKTERGWLGISPPKGEIHC